MENLLEKFFVGFGWEILGGIVIMGLTSLITRFFYVPQIKEMRGEMEDMRREFREFNSVVLPASGGTTTINHLYAPVGPDEEDYRQKVMTQAEYDALPEKDEKTIYYIVSHDPPWGIGRTA